MSYNRFNANNDVVTHFSEVIEKFNKISIFSYEDERYAEWRKALEELDHYCNILDTIVAREDEENRCEY